MIIFIFSLFYQVLRLDINNPKTCLNLFKLNNLSGLVLFVGLLTISF